MSGPAIGCIADDYTGGTDVAAAFRRQGLRTVYQGHAVRPVTDNEAQRLNGLYR